MRPQYCALLALLLASCAYTNLEYGRSANIDLTDEQLLLGRAIERALIDRERSVFRPLWDENIVNLRDYRWAGPWRSTSTDTVAVDYAPQFKRVQVHLRSEAELQTDIGPNETRYYLFVATIDFEPEEAKVYLGIGCAFGRPVANMCGAGVEFGFSRLDGEWIDLPLRMS